MNTRALSTLACLTLFSACAGSGDDFSPLDDQSQPDPDGKSDEIRECGDQACTPGLCGYDCTTTGSQCTRTCAAEDGRSLAYVAANVTGAESTAFDSRSNPYDPVFALDDVLVYGCQLWDFSDQAKDGIEIQFEELVHSSFIVDANDPTRYDRRLTVYVAPFTGPGSYHGEALYTARHDAPRYYAKTGCAVDVEPDQAGGVRGTFSCDLPAQVEGSGAVAVHGEFGCPVNAMSPIFSRWIAP